KSAVSQPTAAVSAERLTTRPQLGKLALHGYPGVPGAKRGGTTMTEQNQTPATDDAEGQVMRRDDAHRDDAEGHHFRRDDDMHRDDDTEGHLRRKGDDDSDDVEGH